MGIGFKRVLTDTTTYEPLYWECCVLTEKEIRKYESDNPFPKIPKTETYCLEDFINDVKRAEGVIAFPSDTPEKVLDWIVKVIAELVL